MAFRLPTRQMLLVASSLLIVVGPICASPTAKLHESAALSHVVVRSAGKTVDWAQYGFDAGHSGYNPKEKTIGISNVGQLQQAWSFSLGSSNLAGNVIENDGQIYAPYQWHPSSSQR